MKCLSPHCVCCGRGADLTVERKRGLQEPMCAACYVRMGFSPATLPSTAIAMPCGCGPSEPEEEDQPVPEKPPRQYLWVKRRETLHQMAKRLREEYLATMASQHAEVFERVIAAVTLRYGTSRDELMSVSHQAHISRPRGIVMYLLQQHAEIGMVCIARFFGMHGSTAGYQVDCVRAALKDGWPDAAEFRKVIARLSAAITGKLPMEQLRGQLMYPRTRQGRSYLPGILTPGEISALRRAKLGLLYSERTGRNYKPRLDSHRDAMRLMLAEKKPAGSASAQMEARRA